MIRRNIYKWHRTLSLIIALPVVLWAASGFMHPIMTTVRPRVSTQFLTPVVLDSSRIKVPLQQALIKNGIDSFHNFRLVHIDTNWFYQVQKTADDAPVYLSTHTGRKLPDGDLLYAQYIGKQFLEGQATYPDPPIKYASVNKNEIVATKADAITPQPHDCCDAATACVLTNETGSKVSGVSMVTSFTSEYKSINRLLPVYKISFDRADGIRMYVETTQDRFAFAMDNKRAVFDKIFGLFHTWEWMNFLGNAKYYVMMLLTGIAFLTTLMGLYIFFTTKAKKPKGNTVLKTRRTHRWTALAISLFTLMFTGSGAYHAFAKLGPDTSRGYFTRNVFKTQDCSLDIPKLLSVTGVDKRITNISRVAINGTDYWQVFYKQNDPGGQRKDLMKTMSALPPSTLYVSASNYSLLIDGEKNYAAYLAGLFNEKAGSAILKTELITKFAGEYGFINKRLPVWKISYAQNSNERYYVETSSGKLAAEINDKDLAEGYSFALLHKHEFMAWAGKPVKDFSTMFWATAQIIMVATGLALYIRMKKRKRIAATADENKL